MRILKLLSAHEAAGALGTRHSPRPLLSEGGRFPAKLGPITPRDREGLPVFEAACFRSLLSCRAGVACRLIVAARCYRGATSGAHRFVQSNRSGNGKGGPREVQARWVARMVMLASCETARCADMGSDSFSEESPERRFRTLFISDVHLGARGSQAERLLDL